MQPIAVTFALATYVVARAAAQQALFDEDVHRAVPAAVAGLAGSAHGDLDGDGDVDALRGGLVLLNDGGGTFRAAACAAPALPWDFVAAAALGDVDGDGDLDALLAGEGADELWLNDGSACFATTSSALPAPSNSDLTRDVEFGDVDGDGDLDVVLANQYDEAHGYPSEARLWLNDGLGAFTDASAQIPPSADDIRALALGDVDGDLDLDLFTASSWTLVWSAQNRLYVNDGAGNFSDATGQIPYGVAASESLSVAFADLDGDLDRDVVAGAQILVNTGAGLFVAGAAPFGEWNALADVDGDFDVDGLASSPWTSDRVLYNDGAGGFNVIGGTLPPSSKGPGRPALFDADGDGDSDAFVGRLWSADVYFNANGSFLDVSRTLPSNGDAIAASALGDVDGDGDLDLFAACRGQDQLYVNDQSGAFDDATAQLPSDSLHTAAVALADVDGDGDLDALLGEGGDVAGSSERLYLNDGAGAFVDASSQWPTPSDWTRALVASDVDSDGDADVFTGNTHAPNRLYFNDGAGHFAEVAGKWPSAVMGCYAAAFGRIDNDPHVDGVLATANGVELFLNDGSGGFTLVPGPLPGGAAFELVLGDFDGDTDLDIVFAGYGGLEYLMNDGSGSYTLQPGQIPTLGWFADAIATSDLDGDGDLDLLAHAPLAAYLNDGTGNFVVGPRVATEIGGYDTSITLGDLDLDGDGDVVLGHWDRKSRVVVNVSRHLARRDVPRIAQALDFDVFGPPSKPFTLFGSTGKTLLPFGATGVLAIQRSQIFFITGGVLDASGRATATWNVPNNPALYGTSLYWQALLKNPRRLTNLEITTFVDL